MDKIMGREKRNAEVCNISASLKTENNHALDNNTLVNMKSVLKSVLLQSKKSLVCCHLTRLLCMVVCIIFAVELLPAQDRQAININNENSLQSLIRQENQASLKSLFSDKAEKFRLFEYNPRLKNFTMKNQGDILLLDFFEDKKYQAIVQKVTVSYDGITAITAKILDAEFGYCYISISERGIAISVDIPQHDEQFLVSTKNGRSYLSQHKMSEMKKNELPCGDVDLHENEPPEYEPTNADTASFDPAPAFDPVPANTDSASFDDAASDVINCTFPPDDLSDSVTVNVLIVYTDSAEIWADSNESGIDLLINQAMQRANTAMENSLTNITFNLVYKYKTNYIESNSSIDLDRLTYKDDGYMDEVHDLRKQYKADLVMLIPKVEFTGGLAWLLNFYIPGIGRPDRGFGLSRVQQSSWGYTVVHEMGHNMGCGHHWQQNTQPGPGLFSYSSGYRGQDTSSKWYSTIMTYDQGSYFTDGKSAPRIAFFSDPDIMHNGVNIGDATHANNALTLRQSKHAVSRYAEYYIAELKCLDVDQGVLSPAFHPDTLNYTVILPPNASTITVYATPAHSSSVIFAGGTGSHSLSCGMNTIAVKVRTSLVPRDTSIYTINVIRACLAIVSPTDTTICQGDSVTLNVQEVSDATFKWYDSPTDGTLLDTGINYTVSPISTTDYYVSQIFSSVESARTKTTVTIIPLPNAPTANNITTCFDGNTYTASATANTNESIVWYTSESDGTITTAPSNNNTGTITAYAAAKNDITHCESTTRTAVSVTIYSLDTTNDSATICYGSSYSDANFTNLVQTGIYKDTLQNIYGCDSIVILNLYVRDTVDETFIYDTINNGQTYTLNGFNENTTGTYPHTLSNVYGCDSMVTLNLYVRDTTTIEIYRVSVLSNNTRMGNVSGSGEYAPNATAIIDATANSGYRFVQWDDNNTQTPRTITVTQDTVFTANFEPFTAIIPTNISAINIYPNPTTESIHISLPKNMPQAIFTLYDMQSKELIRQEISNQDKVEINDLASGIYIYKITTIKENYQGKLIIRD
ncbi:MAG: M12 family metallo-peptidase [Bacteroidales bacterium]|nr:M12 family metallo-peptidase [Bacteroidales bacterium]